MTLFLAGHETTAQALAWTWYLLSQHPAAEAKLHEELAAVLAGRTPRNEDLVNLPYTRMVLEEAMRLIRRPTLWDAEPIAADEVLGHRIPARSTVLVVPWMLHRKPSLWERPDRFEPERFSAEQTAARPRFAYLPFGAGPRICIGAAFAMAEGTLHPGNDRTALSAASQARPSARARRQGLIHDPAALWSADDPGAPAGLGRDPCAARRSAPGHLTTQRPCPAATFSLFSPRQ